jgi:hypothetical protein
MPNSERCRPHTYAPLLISLPMATTANSAFDVLTEAAPIAEYFR